jgi:hypothetical protein
MNQMQELCRDPDTGRLSDAWPTLEYHRSLLLLAACNLHGPDPNSHSVYGRCITVTQLEDVSDGHLLVAIIHLVVDKGGELGLARCRFRRHNPQWQCNHLGIGHLGR